METTTTLQHGDLYVYTIFKLLLLGASNTTAHLQFFQIQNNFLFTEFIFYFYYLVMEKIVEFLFFHPHLTLGQCLPYDQLYGHAM